jgi:hypothetical protein
LRVASALDARLLSAAKHKRTVRWQSGFSTQRRVSWHPDCSPPWSEGIEMKTATIVAVAALCAACSRSATREERLTAAVRERSTYCDEQEPQAIEEVLGAVQSVDPMMVVLKTGRTRRGSKLVGAKVSLRALRGITPQWLERTLHCHQAQRTLDPSSAVDLGADPFWLPDGWVDIEVRSVRGGFVAELRGATDEDAEEIYARAEQLILHTTAWN